MGSSTLKYSQNSLSYDPDSTTGGVTRQYAVAFVSRHKGSVVSNYSPRTGMAEVFLVRSRQSTGVETAENGWRVRLGTQ